MTVNKEINIRFFLLLGFVIGVVIDLLFYTRVVHFYPYFCMVVLGLFYAIAYDDNDNFTLLLCSAFFAMVACIPFMLISLKMPTQEWYDFDAMLLGVPILIYTVHSFNYGFHLDETYKISYKSLFYAVWNTVPILLVAAIFSLIVQSLILLTTIIFGTLNFSGMAEFLSINAHFTVIFNIFIFFVGIAKQNIHVLDSFRSVLFKMMYFIYPFLAVISVVFFCLYLFQGVATDYQIAMSRIIMANLIFLGIIFLMRCFKMVATLFNTQKDYIIF